MTSRVVKATFRVVTPAFLGGAETGAADRSPGADTCEVRTGSLKGVLLFWWRALHGVGLSRQDLKDKEKARFGSTEEQSKWLFDTVDVSPGGSYGKLELDEGGAYLAGQGVAQRGQQGTQLPYYPPHLVRDNAPREPLPFESARPYLRPGRQFTLRVFRRQPSPGAASEAREIYDSILALATFGGLGARSRRGFGSLHLEELAIMGEEDQEPFEEPTSLNDWETRIGGLLNRTSYPRLPPFTHFCDESRILVLDAPGTPANELHEELGRRFLAFRSHERVGGVGEADHDDMAAWLNGGPLGAPPRRAVFGLPHNYYFSDGTKVDVGPARNVNRRASPLFLHVDEMGDDEDRHGVAVVTFLPATFLNEQIRVRKREGRPSDDLPPRPIPSLWKPIVDWLDDLKTHPPCGARTWWRP